MWFTRQLTPTMENVLKNEASFKDATSHPRPEATNDNNDLSSTLTSDLLNRWKELAVQSRVGIVSGGGAGLFEGRGFDGDDPRSNSVRLNGIDNDDFDSSEVDENENEKSSTPRARESKDESDSEISEVDSASSPWNKLEPISTPKYPHLVDKAWLLQNNPDAQIGVAEHDRKPERGVPFGQNNLDSTVFYPNQSRWFHTPPPMRTSSGVELTPAAIRSLRLFGVGFGSSQAER